MTSEDGDDAMALANSRPITVSSFPAAKPEGGARLLSFLLRGIVMAVALALFFVLAGIAVFILLLLFVLGRVLRRRRRLFHAMVRPLPAESCGLSQEELQCLPCFCFSGRQEAIEMFQCECAVCLDVFREGEWCRAIPGCNHVFHALCVDRWLEKSQFCPICRGSAVTGDQGFDLP
ncbi:hypothetical protein HPP92_025346 [Vanilla planifolia]|uniref:RING-type domain-containing protein n=1 Tax=Vanilla planifolia TaxID=51239 RepID=A0A835UA42_VANPL|nr:hypothetical protein HPP92_025346 [Vanilla planifolia]